MDDSNKLYHLAYLSQRASDVSDDDVVDGIVLPSLTKNRRLDVTGCLWFGEGRFVQVLEGERKIVEEIFDAIKADERHFGVHLLAAEPIEVRQFRRFNMRAIRQDAPVSLKDLLQSLSIEKPVLNPGIEFERLVRSVIADLSEWSLKPGAGGGPAQVSF